MVRKMPVTIWRTSTTSASDAEEVPEIEILGGVVLGDMLLHHRGEREALVHPVDEAGHPAPALALAAPERAALMRWLPCILANDDQLVAHEAVGRDGQVGGRRQPRP